MRNVINSDWPSTEVLDERYKRQLDITIKSTKPKTIPCLKLLFAFENISLTQQCLEVTIFLMQYVNPAVKGPYIIIENTSKIKTAGSGTDSVIQTARCIKYTDCMIVGEISNRIQIIYIETHSIGIRNRK
ncbi:MAG: hypothetical protein UHD64_04880 [Bacteroidales bacterium]|nr:hypothetical protein [Bacteroidales bacterium]